MRLVSPAMSEAECICNRPMKTAMMSYLKVFAVVLPSYPSFRFCKMKPRADVIKVLTELSAASPEPGIQDLEHKISHCFG